MLWLAKLELGLPVRWANISVVAATVWSRLGEECGGATVLKISDSRSDNSGISFPLPLTMFMIGLVVASLPCLREFWPTRTQGSFPENSSNKLLRMFLSLHTIYSILSTVWFRRYKEANPPFD